MKTIKIAAGVLMIAALAVSCIPKQESMGSAGQTLVKLSPDGFTMLAVDAKTSAQTGILFEVRRDVPSQAALNGTTTVVLKQDTSVIGAYNRANGKSFIELPANLATVTGVTGGSLTINMGPGEFAKSAIVAIPNSANFDFSKSYALGFRLMSVSGEGTQSLNVGTTVITQVLAKNAYHGTYNCEGYRIRPGNPTEPVSQAEKLNTSGATSVRKQGFGNYMTYYININVTTNTIVVGGTTCYKVIATPTDASGVSVGDMFTTWTGDAATAPDPPANSNEINYYNPVKKMFVLNCYYTSSAGNRIMYEVLTKTGD